MSYRILALVEGGGMSKRQYSTHFKKYWECEGVHLACVLMRKKVKAHMRWISAFKSVYSIDRATIEKFPFIIASHIPNKVWVYPNLPLPPELLGQEAELKASTFTTEGGIAEAVVKEMKADQKEEKKAIKWRKGGAKKFLLRRDLMSIAKVLARYTNDGLADHRIKEKAQNIEMEMRPIEIMWAETPEEIEKMYETAGTHSCMKRSSNDASSWNEFSLEDGGWHPVHFYGHIPEIKGAYLCRGDIVLARTFVYKENDEWTWYGSMYGDEAHRTKLISMLGDKGISIRTSDDSITPNRRVTTIKGVWSDCFQDYILPQPYTDNLLMPVYVAFQPKGRWFHVSWVQSKLRDLGLNPSRRDFRNTEGYIRAKSVYSSGGCDYCGEVTDVGDLLHTPGGYRFCCTNHARNFGYVKAYDSRGGSVWKKREDCHDDAMDHERFYTTTHAAEQNGAKKYMEYLGQPIATMKYTFYRGTTIVYEGEEYSLGQNLYDSLRRSSVTGWELQDHILRPVEIIRADEVDW